MNPLQPTRIVDKNGKLTTVHKKTDTANTPSQSLSSLKPTLGLPAKPVKAKGKAVTKIKASAVARLHEDSFIKQRPYDFEVEWLENGKEYYGWRKVDMEIPTATLYDYLRRGIDLTDASILAGLDISPESLDEDFSNGMPGRLGVVKEKKHGFLPVHNGKVIDAMEEAGVPVPKAVKVLENGLQDGHMRNLSIEQLVPLFSKWRYYGKEGTLPEQNSSRLLDAITKGDIPYELTESATRQELSRLEGELRYTESRKPLMELLAQDRDRFIKVAEKAVTSIKESSLGSQLDKPVTKLLKMVNKYGDDVLDLRHPEIVTMSRKVDGEWQQLTLDEAKYCEAVEGIALERGDDVAALWKNPFDGLRNNSNHDVMLKHSELSELHENGVSAESAHEMMVLRKMNLDQALIAHNDNVPTSIADGAL